MKSWLHEVVTVLSLLLFVGTCALWVRSYSSPLAGVLHFDGRNGPNGGIEPACDWDWFLKSSRGIFTADLAGTFYRWRVAYWRVALVSVALPLYRAVVRGRVVCRRRRMKAGSCPACGYDLRASPGRCPECGRVAIPSRG